MLAISRCGKRSTRGWARVRVNWMDRLLLVDIRCKSLLLLSVAPRYSSRDVEIVGEVSRRRFKLDIASSYAKHAPIISHKDNFRSRRNSCDAVCIRYREISHREVNAVRSKMRAESTADTRGQIVDGTHAILDRFLEPILPREPRHACESVFGRYLLPLFADDSVSRVVPRYVRVR